MISLFKDLKIAYFLTTFTGGISILLVMGSYDINTPSYFIALLWILSCAIVFVKIATKRFNNMLASANKSCNIEESLNRLFAIYKGRTHKKTDLVVAIYISNLLLHFGKTDSAFKILLQYNPEMLFKNKKEVVYKFFYYSNLVACYNRFDKADEALDAYKKADETLNSPYFNKKLKSECEIMHKANYLVITDVINNCDEILNLQKIALEKSKYLLSEVSTRFSIVSVLAACERLNEAEEHIKFIKENGGDTLYAKCASQNDFSIDFAKELNSKPFEINPIKTKDYKPLIFSILLTVFMVVATIVFGFFTAKTVYVINYNNSQTQVIHTFDKKGNQLTMESQSHTYFSNEDELNMQYNLCSIYLTLNDYEGCNVTLTENNGFIDMEMIIDFSKTTNDIYDILSFSPNEQDFINSDKDDEYTIQKYKEFLGIRVFAGFI